MKKDIIYIGNFSFPFGNASGKRVYGNGKLLESLGYKVAFIGLDKKKNHSENLKSTEKTFNGFKYYNLQYPKNGLVWLKFNEAFSDTIDLISNKAIITNLKIVIIYGSPRLSLFNYLLMKWCKNNNIKIISDCVDWLSADTGRFAFDLIKWADTTYQKAYLNKKVDGVIAISSFLDEYYKKGGVKTVIIPPLSANKPVEINNTINEKEVRLIYAGIPFNKIAIIKDCNTLKDRIDITIELLSETSTDANFVFNIYGFTKNEYLKSLPDQSRYIMKLGGKICFHGHKENEYVVKELQKSDFTILLRDRKKDTMAGFPSKVSESISNGIPVITTDTSDLKVYLKEGEDSYFINIHDKQESIIKLNKILELGGGIHRMKKLCLLRDTFHYSKFSSTMKMFLNKLGDS